MYQRLRAQLVWFLLGASAAIELVVIASQDNKVYHPLRDHRLGDWTVRLSSSQTTILSWAVCVLVALAFVKLAARVSLAGLGILVGIIALIELLFGKILPSPQNTWVAAVAFALGALAMLWETITNSDLVEFARGRLNQLRTGSR